MSTVLMSCGFLIGWFKTVEILPSVPFNEWFLMMLSWKLFSLSHRISHCRPELLGLF